MGTTSGTMMRSSYATMVVLWATGILGAPPSASGLDGTPQVGTLAYVVTRCSVGPEGIKADQELVVQRDGSAPERIVHYQLKDTPLTLATPADRLVSAAVCQRFGEDRGGGGAELAAPINRVVISPDGKRVVFHVTDDDLPLNEIVGLGTTLPAGTPEGFYVADTATGSLRFLGHKTAIAASEIDPRGSLDPSRWRRNGAASTIGIAPNGKAIAYVDYDHEPGSPGDGNLQVMVLDVVTGRRSQLTDFASSDCTPIGSSHALSYPTFLDNRTVRFGRNAPARPGEPCDLEACDVRRGGKGPRCRDVPRVQGVPISIDPALSISGRQRSVFTVPVAPTVDDVRPAISELYVRNGGEFLQITKLGSSSTRARFMSPDGRRVFFITSADPFGTNPGKRCEVFSVGTNGRGLRQITRFNYDPSVPPGEVLEGSECASSGKPGCVIGKMVHDARTNAVVFMSNCDLLGTGISGEQAFAMWPDGTGVRQLTRARGCTGSCRFDLEVAGHAEVFVELPGYLSYAPKRPERR